MHRIEPNPTSLLAPDNPAVQTPDPSDPPHARRSRAALNLRGLCPVCGAQVTRRLTVSPSETRETYCCPTDGQTVYLLGSAGRRIELPDRQQDDLLKAQGKRHKLVAATGFQPAFTALQPAV